MSFSRPLIYFAIAATLALVIGCSGGGSPVDPGNTQNTAADNIPIIGLTDVGEGFNAVGMLGAYELYLNSDDMTAELVSTRSSAIGNSWTLEGLAYFTIAPCADCLKLLSISLSGTNLKLQFSLSHPFAPGNPSQPPSAKNRLDLDVFDVAMVIKPREATPKTFTLGTAYTDICDKASGYTVELANFLGDNAALPYFLVIDDSTGTGASTNNKFPMGAKDKKFDVYFKQGGKFDMYLTFGYGWSAKKQDRLNPTYYLPEFNKKQAWKVVVVPPEGNNTPSMANTWNDLDTTTQWPVTVKVYDWQQGANVDPNLTNPTDVYAQSEVAKVSIEIPGMISSPVELTTKISGTGECDDPLIYRAMIANTNGLGAGKYLSFVKVEDTRVPQNPIVDRDHLIHSPNGVNLENYTIPAYATYQTFIATVVVGCGPITGSITKAPSGNVTHGMKELFECQASSANGGDPIVLYEWDANYDGITFTVDKVGKSVCLGPFQNPNCGGSNAPAQVTVAVRATDSCSPPNVVIFDTKTITVVCPTGTPKVSSTSFLPIISGDTWFDIGVQPNGFVYIVADHPATNNVGGFEGTGSRTALQYKNNLTDMQVINAGGTGMAQPGAGTGWGSYEFNRIGVSDAGILVTNFAGNRVVPWSVSGTTATPGACCYCVWCGINGYCMDVSEYINAPGYGNGVFCMGQTNDGCYNPVNWSVSFNETNIGTYAAYNWSEGVGRIFAEEYGVVGANGLPNTLNQVVLYSTETEGRLSIVGSCFSMASDMVELAQVGSFGTGDQQFKGGLDCAVDSNGNILTLEKQDCNFRFQKFNSSLVWQWSSWWTESYTPKRMDFDRGDNQLYLLCEEGVAICNVAN